jgi:hypothetical protein
MSSDIFFSKNRHLNLRTGVFVEMMARARKHCDDDPVVADHLAVAQVSGCLGIEQIDDRNVQAKLARCLRATAIEWLEETQANPTRPKLVELLERLLDYAGDLLLELGGQ